MLSLVLDVEDSVRNDYVKDGKVVWMLANTQNPTPGTPATGKEVIATGEFKLFKAGTGTNAVLNLQSDFMREFNLNVNEDTDLTEAAAANAGGLAKLTGTVIHRVTFKAGTNVTANTGIKLPSGFKTSGDTLTDTDGIVIDQAASNTANAIVLKRSGEHNLPLTVDVGITQYTKTDDSISKGYPVATGHLADHNIGSGAASVVTALAVGKVHIDAVCEYCKHEGLKPNPTSFNIRAMDPHTKVLTLEQAAPTTA